MLPDTNKVHTVVFDFDGVFTDNKVIIDEHGKESVVCDRADGLAFDFVRKLQRKGSLKTKFFILSKETNPVVLSRAKNMKIECYSGVNNKKVFLEEYLQSSFDDIDSAREGLIYVGNDLNDIPAILYAGFSVAPCDAHPRVIDSVSLVLSKKGGQGFVRFFIEVFLGFDKLSMEDLNEFILNS